MFRKHLAQFDKEPLQELAHFSDVLDEQHWTMKTKIKVIVKDIFWFIMFLKISFWYDTI